MSLLATARFPDLAPAVVVKDDEIAEAASGIDNGLVQHHKDEREERYEHRHDRQPALESAPTTIVIIIRDAANAVAHRGTIVDLTDRNLNPRKCYFLSFPPPSF